MHPRDAREQACGAWGGPSTPFVASFLCFQDNALQQPWLWTTEEGRDCLKGNPTPITIFWQLRATVMNSKLCALVEWNAVLGDDL